ncbi:MAG: GntR family transcriptional regulator [Clostridia bacterium]|jgi:GntR family transcriptional regulator|nr:GntR family transcriptional regulator [Clostridia bacterium]
MITIDYRSREPIYQQIISRIEDLAASGLMSADEQLPSVRSLAVELSINPNTIQRAYNELERRGIIYSVAGKGSFLAKPSEAVREQKQADYLESFREQIRRAVSLGIKLEVLLGLCEKYYKQAEGGASK